MTLLQRALTIDTISCLGLGALAVLFAGPTAELMGIQSATVLNMSGAGFIDAVGVFLIIFGAFVGWTATRAEVDRRVMGFLIIGNFAWVALSVLLLVTNALALSTAGSWLVLLQADAVLVIAIAEVMGLRRMKR